MNWLAFSREALTGATLEGVHFASEVGLNITGNGSLETAPIEADFLESVVCWNAQTPLGSSLLLEVRVRFGEAWSPYLRVARWGADAALNTSFDDAAEGVRLETDTIVCDTPANALQIRVRLEGACLTGLSATFASRAAEQPAPSAWGLELDVPPLSQMVYPDGGRVWCSPTSTTMLLGYWERKLGRSLALGVPEAAKAVWDVKYGGAGNWAFNMAYASRTGLRAYVAHLGGFGEAEQYIARGVPLALSMGWQDGELQGAPIGHSSGHLVVLRGFSSLGDPIVNDPAHPSDAAVRVVYKRAELEQAWLGHSGGVVYVLEPA
jgi:Peptidase_C39 like family